MQSEDLGAINWCEVIYWCERVDSIGILKFNRIINSAAELKNIYKVSSLQSPQRFHHNSWNQLVQLKIEAKSIKIRWKPLRPNKINRCRP